MWPWGTKQSRSKVNRVLVTECSGHRKHHLPKTQEKTIYGRHQMSELLNLD